MPTALTTATAREDLIEATISLAADVVLLPSTEAHSATLSRLAVLTGRYLNTLGLHPDTGEEEHDELHAATVALLDAGVLVGIMALMPSAGSDGRLRYVVETLPAPVYRYLAVMNRLHNPGRAQVPAPPPHRTRDEIRRAAVASGHL